MGCWPCHSRQIMRKREKMQPTPLLLLMLLSTLLLPLARVTGDIIPIAAILPQTGPASESSPDYIRQIESAINLAVADVNADDGLLAGHTLRLDVVDSGGLGMEALLATCNSTTSGLGGAYGLLGGVELEVVETLGYISSSMWRVPLSTWTELPPDRFERPRDMLISSQPSLQIQMEALCHLILHMKSERDALLSSFDFKETVSVIYSADKYGEEAILAFLGAASSVRGAAGATRIQIFKALVFSEDALPAPSDLTDLLLDVASESHIMVVLTQGYRGEVIDILQTANDAGLLNENYQWIFAGTSGRDEAFQGSVELAFAARGSLAIRPCLNGPEYDSFTERWLEIDPTSATADSSIDPSIRFAYNSMYTLAEGLSGLEQVQGSLGPSFNPSDDCLASTWGSGDALLSAIESLPTNIDDDATFCVQNLRPDNVAGARWETLGLLSGNGTFNQTSLLAQVFPSEGSSYPKDTASAEGLHLRVVTKLSPPFVFINGDEESGYSYSGISMALLRELSEELGFTYEVEHIPTTVGTNTMVEMVADGTYDMGISFITINSPRYETVDFSYPMYDLGLSFIVQDDTGKASTIWGIFSPFTTDLWTYIAVTTLIAIALLAIFEGPKNDDLAGTMGRFSLAGKSAYVTLSLLFQQLTHKPETLEGYMLTISFMFFALVCIASYTAELASFITISKFDPSKFSVSSLRDGTYPQSNLVIQTGGAIENSYRRDVIGCESDNCRAEQITYRTCSSLLECFDAVNNGSAAATVYDSPVAEYLVANQYCGLKTIGDIFDKQHYGIALPPNSPIVDDISAAVLRIREGGLIAQLEQQYIYAGTCAEDAEQQEGTASMTFSELGGLFLITGVLMILCCIIHLGKKWHQSRAQVKADPNGLQGISPIKKGRGDPYGGLTRSERKRMLFDILIAREFKHMNDNPQERQELLNHMGDSGHRLATILQGSMDASRCDDFEFESPGFTDPKHHKQPSESSLISRDLSKGRPVVNLGSPVANRHNKEEG